MVVKDGDESHGTIRKKITNKTSKQGLNNVYLFETARKLNPFLDFSVVPLLPKFHPGKGFVSNPTISNVIKLRQFVDWKQEKTMESLY